VLLSGRRRELLDELQAELGDRVEVLPADLSDRAEVVALADRAGAVDVLVANAGLGGAGPLADFTRDQAERVLDVNLGSAVILTHALLPGMLDRGRGHLVYMSSMAGKAPTVGASLYAATKFGLRGFALALHEDLRATPIGVTAIYPGFIAEAGMWGDTGLKLPRVGGGLRKPDDVAAAVLRGIATGRAEIDVAPIVQRAGGWLTGLAPRLVAASMRLGGSERLSRRLSEALREKR
jgi:short-subunit dehydrogenase